MPRHTRPTRVFRIALRELDVLRVIDVTPGMRRVTLTGEQLDAFETGDGISLPAFVSPGFDDDIRLIFPYPGETVPVLPTLKPDGGLSFPKDPKVLAKVYTVRRYDAERRELDIDFVKHGVGVATTWAYRTQPGDRIHVAGPSSSLGLPEGADWMLVAGDDTALPAIARLLDELPDDARAQVFIEVAEAGHRQQLRELPGVQVTWLSRNGAEPGTTGLLLDAVKSSAWVEGDAFAWIAGEQSVVRDLRRHLIEDRGLDKTNIDFTGYWKRQTVVALEQDAAVPDPEKNETAFEKFHELAEILPPLALRVAANLGIAEHISRGITSLDGLVTATGTDATALAKFLRYLEAIEILSVADDVFVLTETGEILTNEYVLDVLRSDGITGTKEQAFFGLEESLRTGKASFQTVTGRDYASLREDADFEHRVLADASEYAGYSVEPLLQTGVFEGVGSVVIRATNANAIAEGITRVAPDAQVTIAALPTAASWFRDDLARTIGDESRRARVTVADAAPFDALAATDAVLLIEQLAEYPDADAVLLLQRAAASLAPEGRILLSEHTFDVDDLDEHDAEHDLLMLTLNGSGHRTDTELDQLIAAAGLIEAGTAPLSWGAKLRILVSRE